MEYAQKKLLELANEIISRRKNCSISDLKTLINNSIIELEFNFNTCLFKRVLSFSRDIIRQNPDESIAELLEEFMGKFMEKTTENMEKLQRKELKLLLNFKWIFDSNIENCNFPKQIDDLALLIINDNSKLAEYALKIIISIIKSEVNEKINCQQTNKIIHLYKLAQKLSIIYNFNESDLIKLNRASQTLYRLS